MQMNKPKWGVTWFKTINSKLELVVPAILLTEIGCVFLIPGIVGNLHMFLAVGILLLMAAAYTTGVTIGKELEQFRSGLVA